MAPRQLPEARTEREASHIQVLVESRWDRSGCAALGALSYLSHSLHCRTDRFHARIVFVLIRPTAI